MGILAVNSIAFSEYMALALALAISSGGQSCNFRELYRKNYPAVYMLVHRPSLSVTTPTHLPSFSYPDDARPCLITFSLVY